MRFESLRKALREADSLNTYRLAEKRGDFFVLETCNAAVQDNGRKECYGDPILK